MKNAEEVLKVIVAVSLSTFITAITLTFGAKNKIARMETRIENNIKQACELQGSFVIDNTVYECKKLKANN